MHSHGPFSSRTMDHLKLEVRNRFFSHAVLLFSLAAAVNLAVSYPAAANPATDWQPYEARYAVYRNGELIGQAELRLQQHGDRWIISSEGSGTHGLARLLGATDTEQVEGQFAGGKFLPAQYFRHTRVAGVDHWWHARFDWPGNRVAVSQGRNAEAPGLELDMGDGALDPLSLKLELQRRLRDDERELSFFLVDEDEIKPQTYRVLPQERLETSLGCLDTLPVERVRTGSSRYTRAWYAPDLEYITVRLEHGKTGGDHMEMRISELIVEGTLVQARSACQGGHSSGGNP